MSKPAAALAAALALAAPGLARAEAPAAKRLEVRRSSARELRVENHGSSPMRVQLSAAEWEQGRDGDAQLTPTAELALAPAVLTLAPGASQAVRVERTGPAAPFEVAYQVVAQEQGAAAPERATVPVFVGPERAAPRAEMSPPQLLGCTASFELRNTGSAHLEVKRVRLVAKDSAGRAVAVFDHAMPDVLSGVSLTVSEVLSHDACKDTVMLTADVETAGAALHTAGMFALAAR